MEFALGYIFLAAIFCKAFAVMASDSCQLSVNISESPSSNESSKHIISGSVECTMTCRTIKLPSFQNCGDQKNSSDNKTGSSLSGQVLVSTEYNISLIDVSNGEVLSTLTNETFRTYYSIDYLYDEKVLFYSFGNFIFRADIEETVLKNPVDIVYENRNIGSIAVDWVNRKLYWTMAEPLCAWDSVKISDLDGSNGTALFECCQVCLGEFNNDLVVDPYNGFLFLISNETVYKSNLDGSNLKIMLEKNDAALRVYSIALDRAKRKLYFTAFARYQGFYLGRVDYDGTDPTNAPIIQKFNTYVGPVYSVHFSSTGSSYSLDVLGETVYIARTNDSLYQECPSLITSLSTKNLDEPSITNLYQPNPCYDIKKIKLYHPCAQSLSCEDKV